MLKKCCVQTKLYQKVTELKNAMTNMLRLNKLLRKAKNGHDSEQVKKMWYPTKFWKLIDNKIM